MLGKPKRKFTFDQMDFVYEMAFEAMLKTLFEEKYTEHGWTYEEFCEAAELAELPTENQLLN